MENWSQYLEEENNSPKDDEKISTSNMPDERIPLRIEDVRAFCERLSGKNEQGLSKAIISYQSYDSGFSEEETTDKNADKIYTCAKASVELAFDALNPGLLLVTLTFPTHDDPELRLFWARLQKWNRRESGQENVEADKVPIFLLHLFERDSISVRQDVTENILEANIINPIICYLTREIPSMPAVDTTNEKGETMGGNVIKMLCNMEFITFSLMEDVDTSEIRAEVQRENENARYLEAAETSTDTTGSFNLN